VEIAQPICRNGVKTSFHTHNCWTHPHHHKATKPQSHKATKPHLQKAFISSQCSPLEKMRGKALSLQVLFNFSFFLSLLLHDSLQNRWFVLEGSVLTKYYSKDTSTPTWKCLISGATIKVGFLPCFSSPLFESVFFPSLFLSAFFQLNEQENERKNEFRIISDKRIDLQALDRGDYVAWLLALRRAIQLKPPAGFVKVHLLSLQFLLLSFFLSFDLQLITLLLSFFLFLFQALTRSDSQDSLLLDSIFGELSETHEVDLDLDDADMEAMEQSKREGITKMVGTTFFFLFFCCLLFFCFLSRQRSPVTFSLF